MSVQLLDKTRKINKLLHNNNSTKVVFNDICKVMMETLDSNILVISKKGKVLGVSLCPGVEEITELIEDKVGSHVDPLLNDRFLSVLSTKENVNLQTLGFERDDIQQYCAIINPIDIAGERLGTVFMYRKERQYDIEDIIVSEYGTTVVGLEMMRSVNEENAACRFCRRRIGQSADDYHGYFRSNPVSADSDHDDFPNERKLYCNCYGTCSCDVRLGMAKPSDPFHGSDNQRA